MDADSFPTHRIPSLDLILHIYIYMLDYYPTGCDVTDILADRSEAGTRSLCVNGCRSSGQERRRSSSRNTQTWCRERQFACTYMSRRRTHLPTTTGLGCKRAQRTNWFCQIPVSRVDFESRVLARELIGIVSSDTRSSTRTYGTLQKTWPQVVMRVGVSRRSIQIGQLRASS